MGDECAVGEEVVADESVRGGAASECAVSEEVVADESVRGGAASEMCTKCK